MKTVREHLIEIFGIDGTPTDAEILDAVETAIVSKTHFALLVDRHTKARILSQRTVEPAP
jgi:hypothetical protein